jgi:hypothetical protein
VGKGFGVQGVQFLVRELTAPLKTVGTHEDRVVVTICEIKPWAGPDLPANVSGLRNLSRSSALDIKRAWPIIFHENMLASKADTPTSHRRVE